LSLNTFFRQLLGVRQVVGIALAILVCAHNGTPPFHRFIQKDRVLMRMVNG
jgi:cytochrome b561